MTVAAAVTEPPRRESLWLLRLLGAASVVAGLVWVAFPGRLARHVALAWEDQAAVIQVFRAAGPALIALGIGALGSSSRILVSQPRVRALVGSLLAVTAYLGLASCLRDWIIDDAAITFAYSDNLRAGHGLVLHPGYPPEEGYSNTLWMLMLAGARALGADIAVTAKALCALFGAITVVLSGFLCRRLAGDRARFTLLAFGASICLGAPFVIWSTSGLEHGLQAALLAAVAAAPFFARPHLVIASALTALVLLRPEAPLLVGAVLVALALPIRSVQDVKDRVRKLWPVAVAPGVALVGLLVFRKLYFGDFLPNPYYAKAQDAGAIRLFNILGGGWQYVFGWLADARTWLLVSILLIARVRKPALAHRLAVAVCIGQLLFVVYAGGDWMSCYRFIAPVLPVLAALLVSSAATLTWSRMSRDGGFLALTALLGLGTLSQLVLFRATPTTPTSVVAAVGKTFVEVGHRLGVAEPVLAHHDSGGTSYEARIAVVDLGGLGDRQIAKHMRDQEFMRHYLFEQRRPTFFFGSARNFAAMYGFPEMPEFGQYVRLVFPNRPYMNADLCHVRRDVVHPVPGIRPVSKDGQITQWIVD